MATKKTKALLDMLLQTEDFESNCDDCFQRMAEFAEVQLEGKSVPESLKAIEEHMARCSECRQEFEALKTAIEAE